MGSCKEQPSLTIKDRLFQGSRVLLILLALILSCCQPVSTALPSKTPTTIPQTQNPYQVTLAPATVTMQPTPSPSATFPPTPSFTPGPSLLLSKPHSNVSYISPLTIQHVTQKSVICTFELEDALGGYLFYWPSNAGMQDMRWEAFNEDRTQHVIEIGELDPGKEYEFAVGLIDQNGSYSPPLFLDTIWDPIRVRTIREELWPLLVGVFGDSGFGQEITTELTQQMASYDLDFVLHTGDIVYRVYDNQDVQEAYAIKYFETLAPILKRFPLYPVPGNHEYDVAAMVEDDSYYFHVFPALPDTESFVSGGTERRNWYAVAFGELQLLMLDTQLFWRGIGITDQTAWLEQRLLDDQFHITIPVGHVPPFTSGIYPNDGILVQRDWVPLFEAAPVPLVLSGHDHNYQRLESNGIVYIVTGGGSSVLYPQGELQPESHYFARRTHFVLLELHLDHIRLKAITPSGEVLDQRFIILDSYQLLAK